MLLPGSAAAMIILKLDGQLAAAGLMWARRVDQR